MLIRFGVQNHRSIAAKQELSLAASSLTDNRRGLVNCPAAPGGWLLPLVTIYGANASGKSNLVSALRFMVSSIRYSQTRNEPREKIYRQRFKLDPRSANAPSLFDVDFVVDGIRHHYGFEVSDDAFTSEWLYSFPNGRRQLLYERKGMEFEFGRALRGRNKAISELTRKNSLFLSAAAQNGHEELGAVNDFFGGIEFQTDTLGPYTTEGATSEEIDRRVIEFLGEISTGVTGYRRRQLPTTEGSEEFRSGLQALLAKVVGDVSELKFPDSNRVLELSHKDCDGNSIFFRLSEESAGTRRLLWLLSDIYKALDAGRVVVVDELNASLHTQACEALLALFLSGVTNRHGAQLIATTHDTNLLRSAALRRDEVWFAEKSVDGATHLYPLTDIRTRKGDNIEKGYLQGRYGAIPFSGPVDNLVPISD